MGVAPFFASQASSSTFVRASSASSCTLPGQSSCMNCPKRSTNGRNVFAGSTFGGGTPTPSAVTRSTLKPLATPSWQKKMWKEVVWRMLNPPPASSSAAGRPFMPSSFSGSSSVHGRPRTLATISPVACGFRITEPPGPCPCTPLPFTLRCTVRVSSVVLLTATTKRPKRERSASPFAKSMRTPGQLALTPVVTPTAPSASVVIDESLCARITVSEPGHSVSAHAPAATAAAKAHAIFFMSFILSSANARSPPCASPSRKSFRPRRARRRRSCSPPRPSPPRARGANSRECHE